MTFPHFLFYIKQIYQPAFVISFLRPVYCQDRLYSPFYLNICNELFFGFASVSPIQRLVMDKAIAAGGANLASAVNIGFFNLGNALGAWLGGCVIATGFGYASPNWAGSCLSFAALFLAICSSFVAKHHRQHKSKVCC